MFYNYILDIVLSHLSTICKGHKNICLYILIFEIKYDNTPLSQPYIFKYNNALTALDIYNKLLIKDFSGNRANICVAKAVG